MLTYRQIDLKNDRSLLPEFHCRINYESETPFARREPFKQYRYVWVTFKDILEYEIRIAKIMDIAVDSHYQHRGIGLKIMRYAERKAKERGATLLRSDTGIENVASQKLHEKQDSSLTGFSTRRFTHESLLPCFSTLFWLF